MFNKTRIEWCDFTWNPITGCRHACEYCYARRQAQRFCGDIRLNKSSEQLKKIDETGLWVLEEPFKNNQGKVIPLPVGFEPTLHRYRLPMPEQKKKPANIFVCSMADLFGEWVPDEWIEEVFKACEAAPQHPYLFLTKNPKRYQTFLKAGNSILHQNNIENLWFGCTITDDSGYFPYIGSVNKFISYEPLLGEVTFVPDVDWVIIGQQTGPGAVPPNPEWVQNIIDQCRDAGVPVFLKNNLKWPEKIQEYPEGLS